MSPSRLKSLPPLPKVVEPLLLLIRTPSTMKIGSFDRLTLLMPRTRMRWPEPVCVPCCTNTPGERAFSTSRDRSHRRRLGELRDRDVVDRVADFRAALLARRRGHDFVELHDGVGHREVERRGLPFENANGLLLFLIADVKHAQFGRARGNAGDPVFPVGPGVREQARADHDHARFGERNSCSRGRHRAAETSLRARDGGRRREQEGNRGNPRDAS